VQCSDASYLRSFGPAAAKFASPFNPSCRGSHHQLIAQSVHYQP